jgi:catalase
VMRIGKMTLNRNPDNFFAETEQVAFHVGHVVPGIDFTNDPLMQGRLFSYTDTQLIRLGGPNFHEIPINRSIAPVHNNQRDGHMRQTINKGQSSYHPNSLGGGDPYQAKAKEGGFASYTERIDARKVRQRSKSFFDHFSQATLFFNSQSLAEKAHLIDALRFELGKVETVAIRERMLGILSLIDKDLAAQVAFGLGLQVPKKPEQPINHSIPADADPKSYQPVIVKSTLERSEALSMANTPKDSIATRKVAILVADGVNGAAVLAMQKALLAKGAVPEVIAPRLGSVIAQDKSPVPVKKSFLTAASVLYDAVYVPGGATSIIALQAEPEAIHFLNEAYKHCKAIAADTDATPLLESTYFYKKEALPGVVIDKNPAKPFIAAIAQHRFWEREMMGKVPA